MLARARPRVPVHIARTKHTASAPTDIRGSRLGIHCPRRAAADPASPQHARSMRTFGTRCALSWRGGVYIRGPPLLPGVREYLHVFTGPASPGIAKARSLRLNSHVSLPLPISLRPGNRAGQVLVGRAHLTAVHHERAPKRPVAPRRGQLSRLANIGPRVTYALTNYSAAIRTAALPPTDRRYVQQCLRVCAADRRKTPPTVQASSQRDPWLVLPISCSTDQGSFASMLPELPPRSFCYIPCICT
ncbi:hypothetical protein C8Q77DRAFT_584401 [Trametes polyzona]|nr:hypothetical protein C8Q77DRAFT_584401 [Trametes polyzona]